MKAGAIDRFSTSRPEIADTVDIARPAIAPADYTISLFMTFVNVGTPNVRIALRGMICYHETRGVSG